MINQLFSYNLMETSDIKMSVSLDKNNDAHFCIF